MTCNSYAAVGSKCVQDAGHKGPHRASHGFQWTDASDAAAREYMANEIGGMRD